METLQGTKVVIAKEMARIESLAYQEGQREIEFMQKAGEKVASAVLYYAAVHQIERKAVFLIGKGNNGGDGFVAGIELLKKGFSVTAFHCFSLEESSPLCAHFGKEFIEKGGKRISLTKGEDLFFPDSAVVVDALLGTGFTGELKGPILEVIKKVNQSLLPVIAIDIPSGVDGATGEVKTEAIYADMTLFLGLAKMGCFLRRGWEHTGELFGADFGLEKKWKDQAKAKAYLVDEESLCEALPVIVRTRHKYQAGTVLGIAGSKAMGGAAKLAGLAALRTGAGMVRLFYPKEGEKEMEGVPFELIAKPWEKKEVEEFLAKAGAVFIGPGIGRGKEVEKILSFLLPKITVPCVIDADGLFYLAKNLNISLPKETIITPHRKEMERLLQEEKSWEEEEFLQACQKFCEKHFVTIVLKGAPTFILHPQKLPLIIPMGDPGMATAGTGDVLTGMIASLCSQELTGYNGAVLGACLHGYAGEVAAEEKTSYSMIASDLIEMLPEAFKRVMYHSTNFFSPS